MSDMTTPDRGGLVRRLPLLAILAIAAVGAFALREHLSFEALAENRERLIALRDAHYLAAALGFIAAYVLIVAFSLPGATVATLTGGFLFGVFPGALFNVIAATAGATAIFLAVRLGAGDRLAARLDASEGRVRRFREALRENELQVLLLMRLVPAVPFFVANLLPALVGVRLGRFVLTTFFGIMPGAAIYTWAGAGLGEVFARGGRPDPGLIFEPRFLVPLLALSALVALPMLLRALGRKGG
ncbi:MAG: VTT domain-containing protein [Rhodobacteraceae bacterium]|nr:VTT domain-containing protein [Paracoccaceae bacterium]